MADLSTQIGKELEDGLVALINRIAFGLGTDDRGQTQDPDIRAWRNGASDLQGVGVIVQATAARSAFLEGNFWVVGVSLIAYTYTADDADQTDLNTIHGVLQRFWHNLTLASLQAQLSNVTVHGIEYADETADMDEDGGRQMLSVDGIVHCHASLAAPNTTTTTTTTTTT